MNNPSNNKNNNNPFTGEFLNPNEIEFQNPLAQTMKLNKVKFQEKVLGDPPADSEIIIENKLKQQLSDKSIKRKKTLFLSGKNMNEFLKDAKDIFSKNEENLILRKISKISQKDYDDMKERIIDRDNLTNLYNTLKNVNCNFKDKECHESVGGISPLTYLIEESYYMDKTKIVEMTDKYNLLKEYIYNYRTINGDGNCFYRAVIFRYLEILILNNKIEYLQNLINDIIISFNSEELKKRTNIRGFNIKPELTYKILILIVDLLKYGKKEEAHRTLVKSFCTSKRFDYAIIFYFRYILYDYIRKNENKVYLKSFPIKIGNLLPSKYETEDGKFLFDDFYQNYLLNFYTDAEKIIIYLTPLVLGIELNVIIYDDNEDEILQKFKWEGNSELKIDDVISVLNRRNHYEIIYTSEDNEKNKNIFINYENNIKSVIIESENNEKQNDLEESTFNLLVDSMKLNEDDLSLSNKPKSMIYKSNAINKNQNINNNVENNRNNNINYNNYIDKKDNIGNNNHYNKRNIPNINTQNNLNIGNNNRGNNIINNNQIINNNSSGGYNNKNNYNNENENNIPLDSQYYTNNNNKSNKTNLNINNYYNQNQNSQRNKNNNNFINNKNQSNQMKENQNIYKNYYTNDETYNYNNDNKHLNKEKYEPQDSNYYNNNNNDDNDLQLKKEKSDPTYSKHYKYNNLKINKEKSDPTNSNNYNNINNLNKNKMINNNNNYNNAYQRQNQNIGLKTPGQDFNQSNISSISTSINSNISNKGFNTPYSNRNQNKCMECGQNIINQNINICNHCFKSKIINELYSPYLEYIKRVQDPMKFDGCIEIKTKKNENSKRHNIDSAINEYNNNYEDKINKEIIINELKKRICRYCQEDNKTESFKIPCNCHFCSKKHLEAYLQKNFDSSKDFHCFCKQTYNREMMFNLGVICNDLKININIINYFQNKMISICSICGKTSNVIYHSNNLASSDNKSENKIDDFLKKLTHYFCKSCYENNNNRAFKCQICKIQHYFIENNK